MDNQAYMQHSGDAPAGLMQGWLTRPEIAKALGISAATLQRWQTRRIGPPQVRIGRKVFYRADAFRDWLIAQERGPVAARRAGGGR
jgi:hypothetical protein